MASDYYDLMMPGMEQFTYLKCPSKIRAALINAGGKPMSVEAIRRRLDAMPRKIDGAHVGEPTDADGLDYRIRPLAPVAKPKAFDPRLERARIAALASRIPDRKPDAKPRIGRPKERRIVPIAAVQLIERVCRELDITGDQFFAKSKQGRLAAARCLVAKVLRDCDPGKYSFPNIAVLMERKDHTTIIHAVRQYDAYARRVPEIAVIYERVMRDMGVRDGAV